MIYEGKWGGKGNTFMETKKSTWSPVINHISFLSKCSLINITNHELYKRQSLISDFTEAQCGNTAAEQIWTFATSPEGTYRSLSFPKMISLCETPDDTKLMTTQPTLSHKFIHLAILFFYMLCVVSVIRFFLIVS